MRPAIPRLVVLLPLLIAGPSLAEPTREEVLRGLRRAAGFFREEVASHGGYVWSVSSDLAQRRGEAAVGPSTIWVQPPGTPSIGAAFLDAHEASGDPYYLDAARQTAAALVAGQMRSGGWFFSIEFDPEKRAGFGYRDVEPRRTQQTKSTLDDDTTTATLRFLMRLDRTLGQSDTAIHDAVEYGLRALIGAQAPNGGWYQWWDAYPERRAAAEDAPVLPASYPESWSRRWLNDWPGRYYTNDNVMANAISTLLMAHEVYGESRYLEAAENAGAFLILAQMPDPQPAWAQQYDRDMRPCWDRKFEPPAISGGESQGILEALLRLHRATGNAAFLRPVPTALEYLNASRLPDGRLARFYELETNRPLYFTKDYQLTHDPNDVPTHYAFVVGSRLDRIEAQYRRRRAGLSEPLEPEPPRSPPSTGLTRRVEGILASLDDRGAWVEAGGVIESRTFIENVATLCRYLEATRPGVGE